MATVYPVLMASVKKKGQRNVRVPAELEADIERCAELLHKLGFLTEVNWSGALLLVVMTAKRLGWLEDPASMLRMSLGNLAETAEGRNLQAALVDAKLARADATAGTPKKK